MFDREKILWKSLGKSENIKRVFFFYESKLRVIIGDDAKSIAENENSPENKIAKHRLPSSTCQHASNSIRNVHRICISNYELSPGDFYGASSACNVVKIVASLKTSLNGKIFTIAFVQQTSSLKIIRARCTTIVNTDDALTQRP